MKTTTTTREYDAKGNLVKEVVVEQEHVNIACSCGWASYAYCPVHGYRYTRPITVTHTITPNSSTSITSHTVASYALPARSRV